MAQRRTKAELFGEDPDVTLKLAGLLGSAPPSEPPPVTPFGGAEDPRTQIRETTTPREQETIPAPVRRAPQAPEPPSVVPFMGAEGPPGTQATIPAPPAISSAASTTRTPDISAPAAISGGLTRIAPSETATGALEPTPNPLAPGGVSRRAPSFLGGRRSLSPMFGREGGLMGGGLGVSNLISGETPDDLSVLKLLQALLSQG